MTCCASRSQASRHPRSQFISALLNLSDPCSSPRFNAASSTPSHEKMSHWIDMNNWNESAWSESWVVYNIYANTVHCNMACHHIHLFFLNLFAWQNMGWFTDLPLKSALKLLDVYHVAQCQGSLMITVESYLVVQQKTLQSFCSRTIRSLQRTAWKHFEVHIWCWRGGNRACLLREIETVGVFQNHMLPLVYECRQCSLVILFFNFVTATVGFFSQAVFFCWCT